jgi:hypothetical protein
LPLDYLDPDAVLESKIQDLTPMLRKKAGSRKKTSAQFSGTLEILTHPGLLQWGQLLNGHEYLDAPCLPRHSDDKTLALQPDYHLVSRGRQYSEIPINISLRRWTSVYLCVVIDVSQILAL